MSEDGEQQWFFISVVNQEQYGPYTADELEGFVAGGSITKETMIWTEALNDQWIPASNVEGLFPPAHSVPQAAIQPAQPARPQLLTGQAAQAVAPLGAAPIQAQAVQPLRAAPVQQVAAPVQPAAAPVQQAAAPVQQAAAPVQQAAAPVQPAAAPVQQVAAPVQQVATNQIQTAASPLAQATVPAQQVAPQRPVKPGMIPSSMLGTAPAAVPVAGVGQPTSAALAPAQVFPGQVAPGENFPAPRPTKASFGVWLSLLISGPVIMAPALALSKAAPVLLGIGCLAVLGAIIMAALYLFRAWSLLQPGGARVTPGKAVGLLFVPLFNLYWMFVAIGGLPAEWNRVMSSHPNLKEAPRFNSGLAVAFCAGTFVGVGFIIAIPLLANMCKGINFMGRLQMMPGGGGVGGSGGPLAGAGARAQQPGGAIRLY